MTEQEASFIIRAQMALSDEGIGVCYTKEYDATVVKKAMKIAGYEFDQHTLWDYNLISDEEHFSSCLEYKHL